MVMYARVELIYPLLFVVSFIKGTQAALQVRTPIMGIERAVASPTSSSHSASFTPLLVFQTIPQLTSCGSTTFSWSYSGPDDPSMSLQVTNIGVSQNAPPPSTSSSSPAVSNSATRNVAGTTINFRSTDVLIAPIENNPNDLTLTLANSYPSQSLSYTWNPVNVSQGWYILTATIPQHQFTQHSSTFFVFTGSNTSCLNLINFSATSSPQSTSSSPHTSTPIPTSSIIAANLSSTPSTSKVPTIIGVSLGMVLLLLSSIIILCFILRKRRSSASNNNPLHPQNNRHPWNPVADSQQQRGGDGRFTPTNKRYPSSIITASLKPESIDDEKKPSPTIIHHQFHLSTTSLPPSPRTAEPPKSARKLLGGGGGSGKRKPVPVYDGAQEEQQQQQQQLPLYAETLVSPELSHKSSFGPGGIEGRQLHYLMPDILTGN